MPEGGVCVSWWSCDFSEERKDGEENSVQLKKTKQNHLQICTLLSLSRSNLLWGVLRSDVGVAQCISNTIGRYVNQSSASCFKRKYYTSTINIHNQTVSLKLYHEQLTVIVEKTWRPNSKPRLDQTNECLSHAHDFRPSSFSAGRRLIGASDGCVEHDSCVLHDAKDSSAPWRPALRSD